MEVRRSRWGYLKEFWFSGQCQSAGSSRKSWSVPESPPFLLKQRGETKKKLSRSRENRTTTKKAPGPETTTTATTAPHQNAPRRFQHFWATRSSEDFSGTRRVHGFSPRFRFHESPRLQIQWRSHPSGFLSHPELQLPARSSKSTHRDATADESMVYVVMSPDGWN